MEMEAQESFFITEILPLITVVVGAVISVVLANLDKVKIEFDKLPGRTKLLIVAGLCVVYGLILWIGNVQLAESVKQLLIAFLSTYITYKTLIKNPPETVTEPEPDSVG